MASFVKYQEFVADLANGGHNLGSDTLKFALTNTAPNVSTHTQLSDITEISAGNGYTAGGSAATIAGSTQTGGTYTLACTTDVVITASGGSIGPFRYVVLYNDTSTNDDLIAYWDYGSSITLNDGESFTIDVTASLLTLA